KITEDEWHNSPASRGVDSSDYKSQSDIYKEKIADLLNVSSEPETFDIEVLQTEAVLENAHFDVNGARDEWSSLSAKQQGRAFGTPKNHDAIRDDYHTKVQKLGVLELKDQISDSDDDTTKNAK